MNRKEETLLHPDLNNRFRIIRLLGSGGMGDVYLAQDKELARFVAVKTIRPDLARDTNVRKRIDIECRLHAAIGMHPNIVALHDRIELEGFVYLILEYVEGVLLSELLEPEKATPPPLGLAENVAIILQILEGLQAIHAKNILHRDIKPSNVMVSNLHSGRLSVKLMDFGIAHAEPEENALTGLTTVDSNGPGTPTYMAPERIDPQTFGAISITTDLYSVGVILFQMLSDGPPFRGTVTEILMGHLTKSLELATLKKGLPAGLQEVLIRSLQKKQADRYPDAGTFAESLKNAMVRVSSKGSSANDWISEQTLLATDPNLLKLQEGRTLLNTKTYVCLPPNAQWHKRAMVIGTSIVVLLIVSLLVVRYSYVFTEKLTIDMESPSKVTETPAVGLPAGSRLDLARPQEKEGQIHGQTATPAGKPSSGVVHSDIVGTPGNDPQKEDSADPLNKKHDSAIDAFNSARIAKVQENSSQEIQNVPLKTNIESRNVGSLQISSRKANESPIKPNCQNLRKNWQLLGDPSSMQKFRQECTN